jgi:hypothetical protein
MWVLSCFCTSVEPKGSLPCSQKSQLAPVRRALNETFTPLQDHLWYIRSVYAKIFLWGFVTKTGEFLIFLMRISNLTVYYKILVAYTVVGQLWIRHATSDLSLLSLLAMHLLMSEKSRWFSPSSLLFAVKYRKFACTRYFQRLLCWVVTIPVSY